VGANMNQPKMIKAFIIGIIGCLCCLFNTAIAQDDTPVTTQHLPLIHLGQKDGLIPNYINDLAVDSLGQLQLATFGAGIISYGGYEFAPIQSDKLTKFPIIRKLKLIDNKHYFITSGELYRWDSKLDSLKLIFKDDSPIINFYQIAPNKILISNYRSNYIAEHSKGQYAINELPLSSPIIKLIHPKNKKTIAIMGDGNIISDPFGPTPTTIYKSVSGGNLKVFELNQNLVLIEEGFISYLDKETYKVLKKIPTLSQENLMCFIKITKVSGWEAMKGYLS